MKAIGNQYVSSKQPNPLQSVFDNFGIKGIKRAQEAVASPSPIANLVSSNSIVEGDEKYMPMPDIDFTQLLLKPGSFEALLADFMIVIKQSQKRAELDKQSKEATALRKALMPKSPLELLRKDYGQYSN